MFGSDNAMKGKSKKPAPDVFQLAFEYLNGDMKRDELKVMLHECLVVET